MTDTITLPRATAQQALEALEDLGMRHFENTGEKLYADIYIALRNVLEQQAEPVGTLETAIASEPTALIHKWRVLELIKYYAPQRKPLTDAEFCEQWLKQTGRIMGTDKQLLLQAKQVTEAAHGIKEGT